MSEQNKNILRQANAAVERGDYYRWNLLPAEGEGVRHVVERSWVRYETTASLLRSE